MMDFVRRPRLFAAPHAVRTPKPRYPQLFSGEAEISMSRGDLLRELLLVLEMRTARPFVEDTYVYSIRVLRPAPFGLSALLADLVEDYPHSVRANIEAGYLVHDSMYGQPSDEGRLQPLIERFLANAEVVEVKLRRRADPEKTIRVNLA